MKKIRSLSPTDLPQLLQFWNKNVIYDPMRLDILQEKLYGDPDFNSDMSLLALENERIVSFMQGIVRMKAGEPYGWIKLFATDTEFRRQGYARKLLQQIEAQMRAQKVTRIGILDSTPNYFQPGIDPFYTPAVAFIVRMGYQRSGDTSHLKAELAKQNFDTSVEEKAALEKGILIRRALPEDHKEVIQFLTQFFDAWIYEVEQMFPQSPIPLHLAFLENELVAFSGHNGNNLNSGWFGPMGTNPNKRGLGVGGILLKRCLQDIKNMGFESAIIPWVGPIPFYMHYANAHVCRVFWRYAKTLEKE